MSDPTVRAVSSHFGSEPRVSPWVEVTQDLMDRFADATADRDWMHTDPERARREGFEGTIAFGFWTLSMLTALLRESTGAELPPGIRYGYNYGLDRVRFVEPIPVGCRIRNRMTISDVRMRGHGRVLVTTHNEIEIEGCDRPAMVADWLVLFVSGSDG